MCLLYLQSDEIGGPDIKEHCPSISPFTSSSYHNSTWQDFFEESKLVSRTIYLLEFFLGCSLPTTKLDMASTRRLGMVLQAKESSELMADNPFLLDL